ncbi:MAG: endonuclease/exonuclease/phosphatase family protein [Anaerolineales bacterium]
MSSAVQSTLTAKRLRLLALPAILIAFGLQTLRVLLPSLVWYLMETQDVASTSVGLIALIVASGPLVIVPIWHFLGERRALWLSAGTLLIARVAEQIIREPQLDLWVSLIGSLAFAAFLAAWAGHIRAARSPESGPRFFNGLLLGLTLDTAIKAFGGSLDLSWIAGAMPLVIVLLLAALATWLLLQETIPLGTPLADAALLDALTLTALGPYLLLQTIIFQNPGWTAAVGGIGGLLAYALVLLGNLLALAGMSWGYARPASHRPLLGVLAVIYLALAGFQLQQPGLGFIAILLIGQFVMGWAWAPIGSVSTQNDRRGLLRTGISITAALVLFLAMAFFYYASLDLVIPFDRGLVFPAAAALFGLITLGATYRAARVARTPWNDRGPLYAAAAISLLATLWLSRPTAARTPQPTAGEPLQALTYNIHSAYDMSGRQDPEAIARVIESSQADIVAVQEISRGWLINGSTDLVFWLSRRLGMTVIFQGTSDPVWGNAVFSRLPIQEWGQGTLPRDSSLIARGYLWARVGGTDSDPLLILATHLHQVDGEDALRERQARQLLGFWGNRSRTLLLGDLNARPSSPAIRLIERTGFVDSWAEAGRGPAETFPADEPDRKIDWIFHTSDLSATSAEVIPTEASDHRPLLIKLEQFQ